MTASGGEWLTDTPLVISAGPGGVGSATVASTLALGAADQGADVLLVALGDRPQLASLLGVDAVDAGARDVRRTRSGGRLRVRTIPASEAVAEVLDLGGLRGVLRRAATAGALPLIAAAAPDLVDVLLLARIGDLVLARAADVIVVAAPPGGHAAALLAAVDPDPGSTPSAAVLDRAAGVRRVLVDPATCRLVPVTVPTGTAVARTLALVDRWRDELGAQVGPVVVNRCRTDLLDPSGLGAPPAEVVRAAGLDVGAAAIAALDSALARVRRDADEQATSLDGVRAVSERPPVLLPALDSPSPSPSDLDQLVAALVTDPATRR